MIWMELEISDMDGGGRDGWDRGYGWGVSDMDGDMQGVGVADGIQHIF